MFDFLQTPGFLSGALIGFVFGGISMLCFLLMADLLDRTQDRRKARQSPASAIRYGERPPAAANDASLDLRDAHVPPRPRTARSELRSRPR